MKITAVKSFPFLSENGRRYHIVKVETDEGIYGLGEIGMSFWGAAVDASLEHLSEIVVGEDPFSTERLWQHMFRGSFFPADTTYCSAISAIDIALWDIKGKALGMPVYKLLGGPVRDKVVCYPHNEGGDTARARRELPGHEGGGLEVRALGPLGDWRHRRQPVRRNGHSGAGRGYPAGRGADGRRAGRRRAG